MTHKINGIVSARRYESYMREQADREQAEKHKRMRKAEIKSQLADYGLNHLGIGKAQDIHDKASVIHEFIGLLNDMRVDLQRELDKYEVK